ncbi:hypothetical protein PCE1_002799 [Barthelona sp. PCE]
MNCFKVFILPLLVVVFVFVGIEFTERQHNMPKISSYSLYASQLASYGPHTGGSRAFNQTFAFLLDYYESIQKKHPSRIDIDVGSISGNWDLWGRDISVQNLRNLAVRVKGVDVEDTSKSVLVNAHIDSVDYSYGTADDGVGVVAMMTMVEKIISRSYPFDVILLGNQGEEYGLLGAKAFVESGRWKDDIAVVINLEGCGSDSRQNLFRIVGPEGTMLKHWKTFNRAAGSSFMSDLYDKEYLQSGTDVYIFDQYYSAYDMVMFPRYGFSYHTKADNTENIWEGAIWAAEQQSLSILDAITIEDLTKMKQTHIGSEKAAYFGLPSGFGVVIIPNIIAQGISVISFAVAIFVFALSFITIGDRNGFVCHTILYLIKYLVFIGIALTNSILIILLNDKFGKPFRYYNMTWGFYSLITCSVLLTLLIGGRLLSIRTRHRLKTAAMMMSLVVLFCAAGFYIMIEGGRSSVFFTAPALILEIFLILFVFSQRKSTSAFFSQEMQPLMTRLVNFDDANSEEDVIYKPSIWVSLGLWLTLLLMLVIWGTFVHTSAPSFIFQRIRPFLTVEAWKSQRITIGAIIGLLYMLPITIPLSFFLPFASKKFWRRFAIFVILMLTLAAVGTKFYYPYAENNPALLQATAVSEPYRGKNYTTWITKTPLSVSDVHNIAIPDESINVLPMNECRVFQSVYEERPPIDHPLFPHLCTNETHGHTNEKPTVDVLDRSGHTFTVRIRAANAVSIAVSGESLELPKMVYMLDTDNGFNSSFIINKNERFTLVVTYNGYSDAYSRFPNWISGLGMNNTVGPIISIVDFQISTNGSVEYL